MTKLPFWLYEIQSYNTQFSHSTLGLPVDFCIGKKRECAPKATHKRVCICKTTLRRHWLIMNVCILRNKDPTMLHPGRQMGSGGCQIQLRSCQSQQVIWCGFLFRFSEQRPCPWIEIPFDQFSFVQVSSVQGRTYAPGKTRIRSASSVRGFPIVVFIAVPMLVCLIDWHGLSVCLSVSVSVCLSVSLCIPVSLCMPVCLCLSLSLFPSPLSPSRSVSVCLSVCLFVCQSVQCIPSSLSLFLPTQHPMGCITLVFNAQPCHREDDN